MSIVDPAEDLCFGQVDVEKRVDLYFFDDGSDRITADNLQ